MDATVRLANLRSGVLTGSMNMDYLVQFLRTTTAATVLGSPQINVGDNETGKIFVGQRVPRIRSMSMNMYVGGNGTTPGNPLSGGWSGDLYRVYSKMGDMNDPGPSRTWVLLDEREDSINDGFWVPERHGAGSTPS